MSKLILHGLVASMSKVVVHGSAAEPRRLQNLIGHYRVHAPAEPQPRGSGGAHAQALVSGSDDDDRTAPHPPAEEREPERAEQGAMKDIEDRERRGRKEGVC